MLDQNQQPETAVLTAREMFKLRKKAPCSGSYGVFFGPDNERPKAREFREAKAKAICAECVVIEQCLDYATHTPEFGIWGGMTERDRYEAGIELPYPLAHNFSRPKAK